MHAQILNVDHLLLAKAKYQKGKYDATTKDPPISMRMRADQDWIDGAEEALATRLGLSQTFQKEFLSIDLASHRVTEEVGFSRPARLTPPHRSQTASRYRRRCHASICGSSGRLA